MPSSPIAPAKIPMFIKRKEDMIREQSGEYWGVTYLAQSPLLEQVPKTTTYIMSQSREESNATNKSQDTTFK
ncbi:uncharacterized protein N7503_006093 [Penicillium pulvis]|uniref:uncharacterized protein n=1 Tax=Penicillium pulvis TaxID=1562058 RepID=UPI0025485327|nr:uncharacterized protein N7503_006093 [Penicillium pulvis]KAJ5803643.1 hypothetical protein N7503_006093 [Penicillium pulvis]